MMRRTERRPLLPPIKGWLTKSDNPLKKANLSTETKKKELVTGSSTISELAKSNWFSRKKKENSEQDPVTTNLPSINSSSRRRKPNKPVPNLPKKTDTTGQFNQWSLSHIHLPFHWGEPALWIIYEHKRLFKARKSGDPSKNQSNSVFWCHSRDSHEEKPTADT